MARLKSPAGDFELTVTDLSVNEDNEVVLGGSMGVWDARIYFPPGEIT